MSLLQLARGSLQRSRQPTLAALPRHQRRGQASSSKTAANEDPHAISQRVPASLVLKDGTVFPGYSFGAAQGGSGEVVFNTGLTSYTESLTDPSYRGQILTSTYPLIGNYGVPSNEIDEYGLLRFFESNRVQVSGFAVSDLSREFSHYQAVRSLSDWLKSENVPGIYGIDTRALTRHIRDSPSYVMGKIVVGGQNPKDVPYNDPTKRNMTAEVSTKEVRVFLPPSGKYDVTILAVDLGIKSNIIRHLVKRGARVYLVPWNFKISTSNIQYDGLFYSNGPGDPALIGETITELRWALDQNKPIFGICMGNQALAQAAGAKTYKMPYGNRGQNLPVKNLLTQHCYVTSQNHGYAVDTATLPKDWEPLFVNINDGSNEGIRHATKPFFSAQFHPEAAGGPQEAGELFDHYFRLVREHKTTVRNAAIGETLTAGSPLLQSILTRKDVGFSAPKIHPEFPQPKKVLILGSGGLSIGQAGEFDYSGSQAIKALKDSGIKSVLMNSNIATVQTAHGLADKVYFLPVTADYVEEVIHRERPDGLFLQFGGQTALNTGVEIFRKGILDHYGVRVCGTSVPTIIAAEDRQIFADELMKINEKIAPSKACTSVNEALTIANQLQYPVIIRSAFSLGGLGSGFAYNDAELRTLAAKALTASPQILVEKSIKGWKEVEYEVVRDQYDNRVTVCNMENFDPMGIHTGDSMVVAPSQTLNDHEYHLLRNSALRVAQHMGIIGECNVQFAINPHSDEYVIIEINPRLSRSSALASKATGYPLAYIAAKLALGHRLPDIANSVTKSTKACFEPSLDYIVTKVPRWDNGKFRFADTTLGSQMKSVGEVMAVGRSFEESFQKALRMVDTANEGFEAKVYDDKTLHELMVRPNPQRIWAIAQALKQGMTPDHIHNITNIDRWFLQKLANITRIGKGLEAKTTSNVSAAELREAKQAGFSDRQIASRIVPDEFNAPGGKFNAEVKVRDLRQKHGIVPVVKQIDTLAAEFPAKTNYLYTSYNGTADDVKFDEKGTMVLGSGVYRIGSSVEFDYSCVMALRALRENGKKTIMVNFNPETVSTDFDETDRLYFEELSFERVMDIFEKENASGLVVSMGGQTAQNLVMNLDRKKVPILGTKPAMIDVAEDRDKFSRLMDSIGVDQPAWSSLTSVAEVSKFCDKVGYPVLVRPSYVLSGAAMNVVHNPEDLERFLKQARDVSSEFPVVVSKFMLNAKEIEIDAIAQNGQIVVHAIAEHVENAGVHSGDATLVLPTTNLSAEHKAKILDIGKRIAKALNISGPFNSQFLVCPDGSIKVIECNLRASRSLPFVSKVLGVDFVSKAVEVFLGKNVAPIEVNEAALPYVGIKSPQFSFRRLHGADPVLGVEMTSTGEVACFGPNKHDTFLKALMAAQFILPRKNILISLGDNAAQFMPSVVALQKLGFNLVATPGTAYYLNGQGLTIPRVLKPRLDNDSRDCDPPNVLDLLAKRQIDMVIAFPRNAGSYHTPELLRDYKIRRTAVDYNIPIITNLQIAELLVESLGKVRTLDCASYQDYRDQIKN